MSEALAKAEKLRKRQDRLAQWKLKKEAEASGSPEPAENDKLAERRRKLELWKQRQESKTAPTPISKGVTLKKVIAKPAPKITKRLHFDSDEEESTVKAFKPPKVQKIDKPQHQDDELDAFMKTLVDSESASTLELSAQNSDSEHSSDDEELLLISSKLKNLQNEKSLRSIDHAIIEYLPFRKSFYVEPPSILDLSEDEIKALRIELDGIKISGKNCPRPVTTWSQLGLPTTVISLMQEKLIYDEPTPIQAQALPAIMSGRDVLGIAKTGSGKTLAFVLPLLRHVQDQPPLAKGDGPIAVLLSPTRELALQIYKQLTNFTKKLGITACCCYGGASIEPQIADIKRGAQVVVSTPGRIIDLLAANGGRILNLQRTTYVVLDEADRMFDFGFEPQINKIFSQIRPDKQCILFSATFARKMESLAKQVLADPVEIVVGGISVVAPEITQHVHLFEDHEGFEGKLSKLVEILNQFGTTKKLVFVEKQEAADKLYVQLLRQQIPGAVIHGGKEQIDRKLAIRDFSSPTSGVDVLIATSIAARGLDVKGLGLVVNFDPASHMEDYVHRVGRTGRAGSLGDAWSFVFMSQERPIFDLVRAMRLSKIADLDIDPRLLKIAESFNLKVKAGKEKYRFGFGGQGLAKLDDVRSSHLAMEKKAFERSTGEVVAVEKPASKEAAHALAPDITLPAFDIVEGKAAESTGPDKSKFHCRVTINDLPQKTRWMVVSGDNLTAISEATSVSITNKGQYYAPGVKVPATVKQGTKHVPAPPKLYLLLEGLTENAVKAAVGMLKTKMLEGLDQASLDEHSSASGRYKV